MLESVRYSLTPDGPRLFIVVLDTAARVGNLIRRHRRIADEDHLVILGVSVNQLEC